MTKRIVGKLHPVRYVVQDNMLFNCIPFIYITQKVFSTIDKAREYCNNNKECAPRLEDVLDILNEVSK